MSDKIKKLSDAIRLGATFKAQARGGYLIDNRTCALGAAAEAIGMDIAATDNVAAQLRQRFSALLNFYDNKSLFEMIVEMNDMGHSRESIADWLKRQGL